MSVMETVGRATVNSDMGEHEFECARDKVASLAYVDPLGAAMVRLMAGNDATVYSRIVFLLSKKSAKRFKCSTSMRLKLSKAVVLEFFAAFCRTCRGSTTTMQAELKVQCPTCHGHGMHRYSDHERATSLGISITNYRSGWANRLDLTRGELDASVSDALGKLKHQLEW